MEVLILVQSCHNHFIHISTSVQCLGDKRPSCSYVSESISICRGPRNQSFGGSHWLSWSCAALLLSTHNTLCSDVVQHNAIQIEFLFLPYHLDK